MHKPWLTGAAGLLLMTGSVYGYWYYMKQTEIQIHTMETVKPVRMLHSGEVIESGMLRKVLVPQAAHDAEAPTDPSDVIGRTVRIPMADSEEISLWKLAQREAAPKPDERYFSFKTDAAVNVNNTVRRGDRVDVWVEFEQPKQTLGETAGAIKIIERLPVAGVKTAEGLEVADSGALEGMLPTHLQQLQAARAKPSGKPELNTYLMNDEVYEAYVLGSIGGKIKLALPDPVAGRETAQGPDAAQVTEAFRQLKAADAFSRSSPSSLPGGSGAAARPAAESRPAAAAGGTINAPASPAPQSKEVTR